MNFQQLIGHSPNDICNFLRSQISSLSDKILAKYDALEDILSFDTTDDVEILNSDFDFKTLLLALFSLTNCTTVNDDQVKISNVHQQYTNIGEQDIPLGYYSDTVQIIGLNSVYMFDDVFITAGLNQDNYISISTIHYGEYVDVVKIPVTYQYTGEEEITININDILPNFETFLTLNPVRNDVGRRFVFSVLNKAYDYNMYQMLDILPDSYIAMKIFTEGANIILSGNFDIASLNAVTEQFGGVSNLTPKARNMYNEMVDVFKTNDIVAAAKMLYNMLDYTEEDIQHDPTFSEGSAIAEAINIGVLISGITSVVTTAAAIVAGIFVPMAGILISAVTNILSSIWNFLSETTGLTYKQNEDPNLSTRCFNLPFFRGVISSSRVPAKLYSTLEIKGKLGRLIVPGGELKIWNNPDNPTELFYEFAPSMDYLIFPYKIIFDNFNTKQFTIKNGSTPLFTIDQDGIYFYPTEGNSLLDVDLLVSECYRPIIDNRTKLSNGEITARFLSAMLMFIFWLNSKPSSNGKNYMAVATGILTLEDKSNTTSYIGAFRENTPWGSFNDYQPKEDNYLNVVLYGITELIQRITFNNVEHADPQDQTDGDIYGITFSNDIFDDDVRAESGLAELSSNNPLSQESRQTLSKVLNCKGEFNNSNRPASEFSLKYYSYYKTLDGVFHNIRDFSESSESTKKFVFLPNLDIDGISYRVGKDPTYILTLYDESLDEGDQGKDYAQLILDYASGWYIEVPEVYPGSLVTSAIISISVLAVTAIAGAITYGVLKAKAKKTAIGDKKKIDEMKKEMTDLAPTSGQEASKEFKVAYKKYNKAVRSYNRKAKLFGLPTYDKINGLLTSQTVASGSPLPSGNVADSFLNNNPTYTTVDDADAQGITLENIYYTIVGFPTTEGSSDQSD